MHLAATKAGAKNLELAGKATAQEAGSANVAVMFDGTWQKRGYKSHNGIGTAISVETGLCLDFEVAVHARHLKVKRRKKYSKLFICQCAIKCNCSAHAMVL